MISGKPLPKPVSMKIYDALWHARGQCVKSVLYYLLQHLLLYT